MVGVPRSNACQLCRKRRVKCDEARPECGNCVKYGADCPGYERSLKFVDGKHQIRQKGRRSDRQGTVSSSTSSQGSNDNYQLVPVPPVARRNASLVTPLARSLLPLRGHLIHLMLESFPFYDSPHDIGGIMKFVKPDRLGKRAILDGAICSLALHLSGKEKRDEQLVAQSRSLYGQCLSELQTTLQHPSEWKTSETLCSAILLCLFELFAGTRNPNTWLQHAKGIGVLMEQRGPAAHEEGWDAAMFLSFRGILTMVDMFFPGPEASFLTRPQWKNIMHDGGRHLIHPLSMPVNVIRIIDRFFDNFVEIPDVLKRGFPLREANRLGVSVPPAKILALAQRATKCRNSFVKWHDEDLVQLEIEPKEVPSENPEMSLYSVLLEHPQPWGGSMFLAYWASMLIIQETLAQCGFPQENHDAAQAALVQKILRSVETVGRGTMGPYRVGFSLRIAYEFANAEAQEWIRGLLDEYSQRYAATDKSTYPAPRLDQEGYA